MIDRLGPKKVLVICTLAAGLLGAGRGLAPNFYTLALAVFLLGALIPFVTTSGYKITGQWFPSSQLGLANGLISMGMALGFMLGSLLSATLLSPLLGGWRNVFILFGPVGALFALPWLLIRSPQPDQPSGASGSIRQSVIHIARLKNVWLLGLTFVGVGGCIQGILGYLPLHLIGAGWDTAAASGSLAAFHTSSMLFVLPIALWSDRLKSRKHLLMAASAMIALGAALMSFAGGAWVWATVLMVGFVRDAFMTVLLTMVVETEGVGPAYAGTAVGLIFTIGSLGMLLAPPLGNGLAATWSGAPFLFWSGLAVFGLVCLSYYKGREEPAPSLLPVETQAQL